jgi:adenylosuccinate synthase
VAEYKKSFDHLNDKFLVKKVHNQEIEQQVANQRGQIENYQRIVETMLDVDKWLEKLKVCSGYTYPPLLRDKLDSLEYSIENLRGLLEDVRATSISAFVEKEM